MKAEELALLISDKNSLSEIPAEELEQLVQQYPYFSPLQVLLLKKYKQSDDPKFESQALKTALYIPDPYLLQGFLEESNEEKKEEKAEAPVKLNLPALEETPVEEELVFEPYHTVDYFASQGVKVEEVIEEQPKDNFTRQLKSFTEWLRTMKRIHPEKLEEINESEESRIKGIAETSNNTEEVITETMADVLIKQGKLDKAIEIYRKLSLLHPEKSGYFAAAIENLKA